MRNMQAFTFWCPWLKAFAKQRVPVQIFIPLVTSCAMAAFAVSYAVSPKLSIFFSISVVYRNRQTRVTLLLHDPKIKEGTRQTYTPQSRNQRHVFTKKKRQAAPMSKDHITEAEQHEEAIALKFLRHLNPQSVRLIVPSWGSIKKTWGSHPKP